MPTPRIDPWFPPTIEKSLRYLVCPREPDLRQHSVVLFWTRRACGRTDCASC